MPEHERRSILAELTPPFTVVKPAVQTSPLVVCSPHSGRVYPKAFLAKSRLDPLTLRKSEDCFVDEIFAHVVDLGAPMIAARFPRAYLDVNREPYEIDPQLFGRSLPDWVNSQSVRVVGGLGTIARIVADGEEIYPPGVMPLEIALQRIDKLYIPFHDALLSLIEETRQIFGYAVLLDCHSMPSSSGHAHAQRPDFVLGDRYGASCDPRLTRFLKDAITGLGYDVHLNRPYAGGYITEHYGKPTLGVHTIQLEINRGLYLNEHRMTATAGYYELERNIALLTTRLLAKIPVIFERYAAAAE